MGQAACLKDLVVCGAVYVDMHYKDLVGCVLHPIDREVI